MRLSDPALADLARQDAESGPLLPEPPAFRPAETLRPTDIPPLRLISPDGTPRGTYLYIHGGGFIHGDAAMADAANSTLATRLGLACFSVEYRLAPAHPWPAPLDDCLAAALWLIRNPIAPGPLLIGGGSVGATLAVQTLLHLRDLDGITGAFAAMNLVAGNYDFAMTPSQHAATTTQFLSPTHLAEMRAAAFPGLSPEALRAPTISALHAGLASLPPAILTVGAADAVRDDSILMASRLETAGIRADLTLAPGADHTFLGQHTRLAAEARRRIETFLADHI